MIAHPDLPPSTRPTLSWRTLRAILRDLALEGRLKEHLAGLPTPRLQELHESYIRRAGDHQLPPDEAPPGAPGWCSAAAAPARRAPAPNGCSGMALGLRAIRRACASSASRWSARRCADVREVMIEAPPGLLAAAPQAERPRWQPSRRRLEWPNGAVAQVFSAEDPESLRGPQFDAAWCDELGKWRHAEADLGHAAVRPAARRPAAPGGHDDAAADRRCSSG